MCYYLVKLFFIVLIMKALVLYDSMFGNTEKVAKAIAEGLSATAMRVGDAKVEDLKGLDILVVGSPVHGGRASQNMQAFIKQIPTDALNGVKVTAFDTRFEFEKKGAGLKLIMKLVGYAAARIVKDLEKKGGMAISSPQGFLVLDKEGPLKDGELERAKKWGQELVKD